MYLTKIDGPLDAVDCVLVVIDPQEKLIPFVQNREQIVMNIQLLVEAAKIFSIPVVVTRQYSKGLGNIVSPLKESMTEYAHFIPDKLSFDCFQSDTFTDALTGATMIICGVETHICVAQTVLSALGADYIVHVAADAVSSRSKIDWEIGLNRMERTGAIISSTEMIVYELLREAGSPEFKALLPFLRQR